MAMNGYTKLPSYEVWMKDDGLELIILGDPPQGGDDYSHNCDQMGCGTCHVLARARVTHPAEAK